MDSIILFVIILILIVGYYFVLRRESKDKQSLLEQIEKLQAALMSKSANDYIGIRAMDKTIKEEKKISPIETDSSELDDETFDKMIEQQNV